MRFIPQPLFIGGLALILGTASALLALLGETAFSFLLLIPSVSGDFSETTLTLFSLIGIVLIEEACGFSVSRAFYSSLKTSWSSPLLLGCGFFLVETSFTHILTGHAPALPPLELLPVLLLHISVFALYLALFRFPLASFLIGTGIHLGYNLLAFWNTPPSLLSVSVGIVCIGSISVFLAHPRGSGYTESTVN